MTPRCRACGVADDSVVLHDDELCFACASDRDENADDFDYEHSDHASASQDGDYGDDDDDDENEDRSPTRLPRGPTSPDVPAAGRAVLVEHAPAPGSSGADAAVSPVGPTSLGPAGGAALGPPGVLPPGEGAVGARVVRASSPPPRYRGVVCSPIVGGLCDVDWRGPEGADWGWRDSEDDEPTNELALDLTGSLDAGTRALWALLGLGEQPLTAPWWGWRYSEPFGQERWLVCWHDPVYGDVEIAVVAHNEALADAEGDICVEAHDGGYVVCTAAAGEEDPRRALALVLAAVAEARR